MGRGRGRGRGRGKKPVDHTLPSAFVIKLCAAPSAMSPNSEAEVALSGMIHDAAMKKKMQVLVAVAIKAVRAYCWVYYRHAVKIMVCTCHGQVCFVCCSRCVLLAFCACFVCLFDVRNA